MVDLAYFHGVKVDESADTPSLLRVNRFGVVFAVGTAEGSDPAAFPVETLVLITNPTQANSLGAGWLKDAVITHFAEGGSYIIVNRVEEGADDVETQENIVGNSVQRTGIYAALRAKGETGLQPRIIITEGDTGAWIDDGVVSISVTNGGSSYETPPTVTITPAGGDTTGGGATAVAVLGTGINVGKVVGITVTNGGENYTANPTVALSGGGGTGALATANRGDVANPIVTALRTIAPQIRARAYVEGPNTTNAEAVRYRNTINSDRILIIDPKGIKNVNGVPVTVPMAPVFAGIRSRVVASSEGVSGSVSNKIIRSLDGVARTINYPLDSNHLNEQHVNTVINERGGLRTWGSRLATDDLVWAFDSVRATADMINEALEDIYFLWVDRKFTAGNLKQMIEDGNAALRVFALNDDILGGKVWLSDLNTPTLNAGGKVFLNVEFEPVGLMEQIHVTTHRNILYYQLMLDKVRGMIEDGPLTLAA